jgi:hypothetical protein
MGVVLALVQMQGVEEANRLMDAGGGITALGSWVSVMGYSFARYPHADPNTSPLQYVHSA